MHVYISCDEFWGDEVGRLGRGDEIPELREG